MTVKSFNLTDYGSVQEAIFEFEQSWWDRLFCDPQYLHFIRDRGQPWVYADTQEPLSDAHLVLLNAYVQQC